MKMKPDLDILSAMRDTMKLATINKSHMPGDGPLSFRHLCDMERQMIGAAASATWSDSRLNRWLGWMQCAIVAAGAATLDDMRDINRRHLIRD